jgi:hypothetical protein
VDLGVLRGKSRQLIVRVTLTAHFAADGFIA